MTDLRLIGSTLILALALLGCSAASDPVSTEQTGKNDAGIQANGMTVDKEVYETTYYACDGSSFPFEVTAVRAYRTTTNADGSITMEIRMTYTGRGEDADGEEYIIKRTQSRTITSSDCEKYENETYRFRVITKGSGVERYIEVKQLGTINFCEGTADWKINSFKLVCP